jgi:hypothetical protein
MNSGVEYPSSGIFFDFLTKTAPQGYITAISEIYIITGMNIFGLIKLLPFFLAFIVPLIFYLLGHTLFQNRKVALFSAMFSLSYVFGLADPFTFTYGFATGGYQALAAIILLLVLLYYFKQSPTVKNKVLAGIFTGLLAYIHPYTFLAAFLIILGILLVKIFIERSFRSPFDTFLVLFTAFCVSAPYVFYFSLEETLTPIDTDFLRDTGVGLEGGRAHTNLDLEGSVQDYILFGLDNLRNPFEVGLEQFFYIYHFSLVYKIRFVILLCSLVGVYILARKERKNLFKIFLPTLTLFSFMIIIYQFNSLIYIHPWRFPGFAIYFAPLTAGYGLKYLLNQFKGIEYYFQKRILLAFLIVFMSTTGIMEATAYYGSNYYPISEDLRHIGLWLNSNTPLESIVASFPKESDTLRCYALRETVCSDEVGARNYNYKEAYDIWKERIVDTFQAFFTENDEVLKKYIEKYNVKYFVIILEYFNESYRQTDRPYYDLSPIIKPYLENSNPIILTELANLVKVYSTTQIIVLKVLND